METDRMSDRQVMIGKMRIDEIHEVMRLDRKSFPSPWSEDAYITELTNRAAMYYVARLQGNPGIVGYGGAWAIDEEAHITTLAVDPQHRRTHIGDRLLITMLKDSVARKALKVSLEVRVSNHKAIQMYTRYGFVEAGRREGYYIDNDEDAIVLAVHEINQPEFAALLDVMLLKWSTWLRCSYPTIVLE